MKTQTNINRVTLKDITRMMNNIEKVINWYNKKYSFNIDLASEKEKKECNSLLERWDFMKTKRNELKAAA